MPWRAAYSAAIPATRARSAAAAALPSISLASAMDEQPPRAASRSEGQGDRPPPRSQPGDVEFELYQLPLDDPEDQQHDDRRDVDAAEIGQELPDRPQDRLGGAVEEVADHRHRPAIGIDHIEGDQPAHHGGNDDDPPVDVEEHDDDVDDRNQKSAHGMPGAPSRSWRTLAAALPAAQARWGALGRARALTSPPPGPHSRAPSRGSSSVGRARRSQCRGQGFDPPLLHQFKGLAGCGWALLPL